MINNKYKFLRGFIISQFVIVILLNVFFNIRITQLENQFNKNTKVNANISKDSYGYEITSFFHLLATPEKYHNKKVMIYGIYCKADNGHILFFNNDAYVNNITKEALYIDFNGCCQQYKDIENGEYVIVCGFFDAGYHKDTESYSGTLKNIVRFENGEIK